MANHLGFTGIGGGATDPIQGSSHDPIAQAIERQTAVLGAAAERQAAALERIADSLAGVEQAITSAQFVETDDQPADPMRTMDSPPAAIVPPRVL